MDVQVVAVCPETPEEIRDGRGKHGLKAHMLSDPDLSLTDAFRLRNQGIHSGPPWESDALPVPTTILIDADGKVLWIDRAENYQRRSGPDVVLTALRTHLKN